MFGFCTKRTKVPCGTFVRRQSTGKVALPFRSSAGLMDACCLRSVPGYSTRLCRPGQFKAEERHRNDDCEPPGEFEEVHEVFHDFYILPIKRKFFFGYCCFCFATHSAVSCTISTPGCSCDASITFASAAAMLSEYTYAIAWST